MKAGRLLWQRQIAVYLFVTLTAAVFTGCATTPEAKSAKHLAACKALMQKKDAARAILEFKTAAQATPKDSEVQYQLGRAYLAAGDVAKGVTSLRRALELNPKHKEAELQLAK